MLITTITPKDRSPRGAGVRDGAFASTAATAAATRLAEILVSGFGRCDLEGRPLSELQRVDLIATALSAFDGHGAELERRLGVEGELIALGAEARSRRAASASPVLATA